MNQDDIEFCKQLARNMTDQSNRATQYPLFYVYQKIPVLVDTQYDGFDYIERYFKGDRGDRNNLCAACREFYDRGDELPEITTDCGCDIIYLKLEDVPVVDVGPFFTEVMAQQHIDSNGYHYNQPFIYVNSAWRNYEMQAIFELIFHVAEMEIPSWYK